MSQQDDSADAMREHFEAIQRQGDEARTRQATALLQNVCRDAIVSLEEANVEEACDALREFVRDDEAALAAGAVGDGLAARGRRAMVAMSRCCRAAIAAAEGGDEDGAVAVLQVFADSDEPGIELRGDADAAPMARTPGRGGR